MLEENPALAEIEAVLRNDRLRAVGKLEEIAEILESTEPEVSWDEEDAEEENQTEEGEVEEDEPEEGDEE